MKSFIGAFALVLAGCSPSVTQVPFLDRVLTVEEFLAQTPLREKVGAFCANNPGQVGLDPNCINVRQAMRIASAGSGKFPRIVP